MKGVETMGNEYVIEVCQWKEFDEDYTIQEQEEIEAEPPSTLRGFI